MQIDDLTVTLEPDSPGPTISSSWRCGIAKSDAESTVFSSQPYETLIYLILMPQIRVFSPQTRLVLPVLRR